MKVCKAADRQNNRRVVDWMLAFRRSLYILSVAQGQLLPLLRRCDYWDLLADSTFVFPVASCQCYKPSSLCSWCSSMFDQSGNHIHGAQEQPSYQESARCCTR